MDQDNYSGTTLISFRFKLILFTLSPSRGSLIKGKPGEEGNLCHNLYVYYEEVIFIPLFYESYLIK